MSPNGPRITCEREGWRGMCRRTRSGRPPCRPRDTQARRLHAVVSRPTQTWPRLRTNNHSHQALKRDRPAASGSLRPHMRKLHGHAPVWMPSPQPATSAIARAVRVSGRVCSTKGYHDQHASVKVALTQTQSPNRLGERAGALKKPRGILSVRLTDRVSAASVKAGAAGASRASARGAVGVTAKLVGCIR